MSESKHTPGPWRVTTDELGVCVADGNLLAEHSPEKDPDGSDDYSICNCADGYFQRDEDECMANARLIAAAPDMLEALTDLVGGCGKEGDLFSNQAHDKARAAIAKATGGDK